MLKVLIGKRGTDSLYGASKTSATVNTAIWNPESLRNGSIGVYGLQETDPTTAGNTGKWVLITNAATGAGLTTKSEFKGRYIKICQGDTSRVSGFIESGIIDIKGASFLVDAAVSAAYTKQYSFIGYNPSNTSGSMNFSGLPVAGDFATIRSHKKLDGAYETEQNEYSVTLNVDEDYFSILSRLVQAINSNTYGGIHFTAGVVSDAPAGTAPTQDITITLGSTGGVLAAADTAYVVGVYIKFGNHIYKIIAKPTSTTVTFDRPIEEATATIAAASVGIVTVTAYPTAAYTQFGIRMTNNLDKEDFFYSVDGFIGNATIDYYQGNVMGSGLGTMIQALEKQALPYRGGLDTANIEFRDSTVNGVQLPQVTSISGNAYDLYNVYAANENLTVKSHETTQTQQTQRTAVAFEVVALGTGAGNTANHNQAVFEDIMTQFYSLTPQISA